MRGLAKNSFQGVEIQELVEYREEEKAIESEKKDKIASTHVWPAGRVDGVSHGGACRATSWGWCR